MVVTINVDLGLSTVGIVEVDSSHRLSTSVSCTRTSALTTTVVLGVAGSLSNRRLGGMFGAFAAIATMC